MSNREISFTLRHSCHCHCKYVDFQFGGKKPKVQQLRDDLIRMKIRVSEHELILIFSSLSNRAFSSTTSR